MAEGVPKTRRKPAPDEASFIYFIGEPSMEHVKIGFARSPSERLMTLQIGNPRPLRIWALAVGTREDESMLHLCFEETHHQGEWFTVDDNLRFLLGSLGAEGVEKPAISSDMEEKIGRLFGHFFRTDPRAVAHLLMVRRMESRMSPTG